MPIAATTQSVAAVVSPRTERPWRMIAPAPRKPMPVTICAAMRVGSARTTLAPEFRNSWNPYAPTIVNSADPSETSRCVRSPASRSRSSRSMPMSPPRPAASDNRNRASPQWRLGRVLAARCSNSFLLCGGELFDPLGRELEQLVEPRAAERLLPRRRLPLDERTFARHDDVHVHVGLRVLGVVEVEQRLVGGDPDGHRRDGTGKSLGQPELVERPLRGDVRARDRSAARAAVCL